MADSPTVFIRNGVSLPILTGRARLTQWFVRWRKPIRQWIAANKRMSMAEVDDLTQEVFLRLLRYSDEVLVDDPQGYLFRVASNVVRDWRQRCRIRMPHDDTALDELQIDASLEPENAVALARSLRCLQMAIEQLPARQRDLLLLHVNEELTYKQVAQMRGLTYRVVLRDLTRAYATLREQLLFQDPHRTQ